MARTRFTSILMLAGLLAAAGCGSEQGETEAGNNSATTTDTAGGAGMVTGTTGAPGPGTTGTPGTPGATAPDTIDPNQPSDLP